MKTFLLALLYILVENASHGEPYRTCLRDSYEAIPGLICVEMYYCLNGHASLAIPTRRMAQCVVELIRESDFKNSSFCQGEKQ